jgi:hypothetical protein
MGGFVGSMLQKGAKMGAQTTPVVAQAVQQGGQAVQQGAQVAGQVAQNAVPSAVQMSGQLPGGMHSGFSLLGGSQGSGNFHRMADMGPPRGSVPAQGAASAAPPGGVQQMPGAPGPVNQMPGGGGPVQQMPEGAPSPMSESQSFWTPIVDFLESDAGIATVGALESMRGSSSQGNYGPMSYNNAPANPNVPLGAIGLSRLAGSY